MKTSRKRVASSALAVAVLGAVGVGVHSSAAVAKPAKDVPGSARPLNILLTNDDGWLGAGGSSTPLIVALRDALRAAGHHVVVVAPGTDQSGQGGRVTRSSQQLTVANPEPDVWTVTPGSPSDSVYFAFDEIFPGSKPDLVVSGMNPGVNAGQAISHSGTVNAATTALEFGVPAMAVSLEAPATWREGTTAAAKGSADYVADLISRLQNRTRDGKLMPQGVGLNVNLPVRPGPIDPATGKPGSVLPPKGAKATTLDTGLAINFDYQPVSGQTSGPGIYSVVPKLSQTRAPQGTDVRTVEDGYASLTPLEADRDVDNATERWLRTIL
ncbi:5'/3'-nucleotidase SurE [Streptomyces sp. NPDC001984]|uniref:5'/3'-nucleotidase SurE n=1 Tax=Streptomyces sp. NPDC002619 TaxID=3364655 RepID=UPI00368AF1FC